MDIDSEGKLYIANNKGLLVFDGNSWDCHSVNDKIIRDVRKVGSRIYTAGDSNFGYWEKNQYGDLIYKSLLKLIPEERQNESFWSMAYDGQNLYLQCFACLYKFDGKEIVEISRDFHLLLQETKHGIFMHKLHWGIHCLKDNSIVKEIEESVLNNDELRSFMSIGENEYLWCTNHGRIFRMDSSRKIVNLNTEKYISPYIVDCGTVIMDKYIAIGTLGRGIFVFDLDGNFITNINGEKLLQNNSIHRLKSYKNHLWVTTDNGVSHIVLNPNIFLWKKEIQIGRFVDTAIKDSLLYLGTNQGVVLNTFPENRLVRMPQLNGEIFTLENINGEILCGSQEGCFSIKSADIIDKISSYNGINKFRYILSDEEEEYLIASSYSYLVYFKYIDNKWKEISHVKDFLNRLDVFMPENLNLIWGIHSQKGIFRIQVNENLESTDSIAVYKNVPGLEDYSNISLLKIDGIIHFFSSSGVFFYDNTNDQFVKNKKLSSALEELNGYRYIINAYDDLYWIIKDNEIFLYKISKTEATQIGKVSYEDYDLTQLDRNVSISRLVDDYFLTSTVEGAVILNIENINDKNNDSIYLDKISYYKDNRFFSTMTNMMDIPSSASDIRIKVYKGINASSSILRYRIMNDDNSQWSGWSKNGIIRYPKLPIGKHSIKIEDYYGKSIIVKLEILPPFYRSLWGYSTYSILVLFFVFYITRYYQKRKRNQLLLMFELEKKKHDEEIIYLKNEELTKQVKKQKEEINEKLRAIVQKQELLNNLSNEIEAQRLELGERYPKRLYERLKSIINSGMSSQHDFMLFQNYYQEINQDFLVKLKKLHPDLSSSDLRFCCLLRSNLSTKDIASILNITPRGVELKRYRIKKKLNLDNGLQDYILKI